MTSNPDKPDTLNTGGGAYIGGRVKVGGDFVGRDKVVTAGAGGVAVGGNVTGGAIVTGSGNVISQPQGTTLEDLRALIAELGVCLELAKNPTIRHYPYSDQRLEAGIHR